MTADADVLTSHDIFRGWAQGERWIAAGPADGVPSPSLWLGGRTGGVHVNQTEPGVVAAAQGDRRSSLLGAASSQDIVCNDARRKAKARSHECNYELYLVAWDGIEPSTRGFSIENLACSATPPYTNTSKNMHLTAHMRSQTHTIATILG